MKKNKSGFFLTIEGCEGTGKSTLIEKLFAHLNSVEKLPVIKTFEPGATEFGKLMREIVLNQEKTAVSKRSELFLFLADRAHHVETIIKPALDADKIVICDRFTDSSLAYQGAARKIDDRERLENICQFAADDLIPDLTLYLDIDPEVGFARLKRGMDRLEKAGMEFHQRVRDGYLELAARQSDRILIIDASHDPETVFQEALAKLKSAMKKYATLSRSAT